MKIICIISSKFQHGLNALNSNYLAIKSFQLAHSCHESLNALLFNFAKPNINNKGKFSQIRYTLCY